MSDNMDSLEQDRRIRALEEGIKQTQQDIAGLGERLHELRKHCGTSPLFPPPMCQLKEGHSGPCEFE